MSEGSDIPVKIRVMAVDEATSAFQKASAAAIQYEQKIAAYTQSKGANVQALKSMQGKLLTLQATKQQADATMMQGRLEERLFADAADGKLPPLGHLRDELAVDGWAPIGPASNRNFQRAAAPARRVRRREEILRARCRPG